MRIGMILDSDFPPDSRVENEAISLIQAGHEVFLFSLSYKPFSQAQETINGIEVRRYKANRLTYKLSAIAFPYPFYHMLIAPKIADFINKHKLEALHVHDMLIAPAVMQVNKKYKLPLVLDLHENRPAIMQYYPHMTKPLSRLLINLQKWEKAQQALAHKADKLILVTEEAKEYYAQNFGLDRDKITVVPNTVHPAIFTEYAVDAELVNRFAGRFNLLYVGDTGLRRGTDIAIRAVAAVSKDIPEIRLIMVGKSTEDIYLKELAKNLEVEDKIAFEGWQDVSLFPSYIQAAHICLSPLKRNLHHDTTFANKIFQYMALGKPLIVSDSTAQANVIKQEACGIVYPAGDIDQMAAAIKYLYRHPEERAGMGKQAEAAVKDRWNWYKTSQQLLSLYNSLGS